MSAPLTAVLAAAFTSSAVCVVAGERWLRRRLTDFRPLQISVVLVAVGLVPLLVYASLPGGHQLAEMVLVVVALAAAGMLGALAFTTRIVAAPAPVARRILAIGAHPDDLELACGGTLARLADSGHEIYGLIMTGGGSGGDAAQRVGEAHAAAGFLGLRHCEVLDLTDTRLDSEMPVLIEQIEARVRRFNPDIIFTHSFHDQHQDHHAVHLATLRAARTHPAILCYESPSTTVDFSPHVFVDIDGYLDVKTAAIAQHRSQMGKPYLGKERIAGLSALRGTQGRTTRAEGFEAVRINAFGGLL